VEVGGRGHRSWRGAHAGGEAVFRGGVGRLGHRPQQASGGESTNSNCKGAAHDTTRHREQSEHGFGSWRPGAAARQAAEGAEFRYGRRPDSRVRGPVAAAARRARG
jgi:hypothetical protein